jgi:hypothetical protein
MANKVGRPKDKENRIKTHILIKRDTKKAIDDQIDRGNPAKSSRGKVVETKF